ncbi:MAG: phosphoserine phosphatase SerB [Pseudomonadota bacterium]
MSQVLTLIAAAPGPPVDAGTLAAARAGLAAVGAACRPVEWLAPALACQLGFSGADPVAAERAVRDRLAAAPIDVAVLPAAGRRKQLLVADMESTLIRNEMLDDLAALAGIADRVKPITRRAMNGEIDFVRALSERVAMLKGMSVERLEEAARGIRLMPGAKTLVATMKAHGARALLVSGGFHHFAIRIGRRLGFDGEEANRLEIEDGALTGRILEPILDRHGKLDALLRHAAEAGLEAADTLAVGDGANDLPMLQAAGLGVAFRAKPAVAASCRVKVEHGDLTALLYLQGYRAEDFVG